MTRPMTLTSPIDFSRAARGRQRLESRLAQVPLRLPGRVPRVSRLMALAIRFAEQIRTGVLASYVELADLGHVSRARISQIMNLTHLAPDLQETLLFLQRTVRGRDAIHLRLVQPIAAALDWKKQRRLWNELLRARSGATSG